MRDVDDITLEALRGTRSGDELVCWVWYDGELALPDPVPISDWSLSWDGDARQKVQGNLSITVKDPSGTLAPWVFHDPLGVGGSRVQAFYQVGGAESVPMGWYRIDDNSSEESWQFRTIREDGYQDPGSITAENYRVIPVSTGASVSIKAKDLTMEIDSDRFIAPEQPQGANPTVRSEIERLIGDTLPIVYTDFEDAPIPSSVVWDDNRLEAVLDLLDVSDASARMTGAGELEIYRKSSTPVTALAGGDDGLLINLSRGMNLTDLYNVGIVESTLKDTQMVDGKFVAVDVPIYGYYEITSGPLRSSGPFGRRVVKAQNPLMNTQGKADKAAETMVTSRLSAQRVDLDVTCLPHPGLQVGDAVEVVSPVVDGRLVPLVGEIVSASLSGGAAVNPMSLTVSCLLSDVAAALRGFNIGPQLTGPGQGLSWANVNPLRTWAQMNTSWANLEGN